MTNRIDYFDALRGLAILGVVATHVGSLANVFEKDSFDFFFTIFWRNFWNFCVPLFISISGYFLAKKQIVEACDYNEFIKKQIPRVYWPMLFWSFIWFFLAIANNANLFSEVLKLITFQSSTPYYFIALIIQYYLLLPVLKRFVNIRGLIASAAISLSATLIIFLVRYYSSLDLPLIIYGGNFLTWIMFFLLGLLIGSGVKLKISNSALLLYTVLFYLLSCTETYLLIDLFNKPKDAVTAIKFFSFIYSFVLITYLFNNQDVIRSRILNALGRYSFGIYLMHMFVLHIEFRVLNKVLPGLQTNSFLYQITLTCLVVFTNSIAIAYLNKIVPNRLSLYIGFK